ncbi:MAG: hypothetical protein ACFB50_14455 [Rubrobacteraceae bacterium]
MKAYSTGGRLILWAMLFLAGSLLFSGVAQAQGNTSYSISEPPQAVLNGIPFSVDVTADGSPDGSPDDNVQLRVSGESYEASFSDGTATVDDIVVNDTGEITMTVVAGGEQAAQETTNSIPGWFSILPPVLAIAVALITRQVIPGGIVKSCGLDTGITRLPSPQFLLPTLRF